MLRHIPQPLHPRRLEAHIGIQSSGNGAVDDGLLLLLQQLDQFLLGADVAADLAVGVIKEAEDGGLLVSRRKWRLLANKNWRRNRVPEACVKWTEQLSIVHRNVKGL